jgi:uncharacterized protein (DUF1800 family)
MRAAARIPVYKGHFGPEQAERLLWRAGFGPRKGEAERLARKGLDAAVHSLTHPRKERLVGPKPHDGEGRPLAPADAWGHDHVWWLDRMVRTNRPLTERMTLIWHDWFATSNSGVGSQTLMLRQNRLLRRYSLDSFEKLLLAITRDPAMLLWLNGTDNRKGSPNENYARELMELFTLGAGRGYTERDVREMARALTGFRYDWSDGAGPHNFRYERESHDSGVKRIHGKRGHFDWRDAVRLSVRHRKHPSFLVNKLWGYFIPTPPPRGTARALERLYVAHGRNVRPLLDAILRHPHLYDRDRRMVKPPVVQAAGMLRAAGRGIDTTAWSWLCSQAGQMLFEPPNVSGWDDTRWLDTATFRARWQMAQYICEPARLDPEAASGQVPQDPAGLVNEAIAFWGSPAISPTVRAGLEKYAADTLAAATERWEKTVHPVLALNALRMLVATSPDYLTS